MTSIGGVNIMGVNDLPDDYFRVLIHGPQGSGKTTLASTIAEVGKTLFVDLIGEKGTRSFKGATYAKNIDVVRPDSVTALDDIFQALDDGETPYKAVVLDSLTALQKMTMRYLLGHEETAVREIKQGAAPADMRTWGQALDVMTDTATFWYGLADGNRDTPMHVIMTAQTKAVDDDDLGITVRQPDVQKGALSVSLATPDYILYTDVENNPDFMGDDDEDNLSPVRHIVRFGANPEYRTKGRVPVNLRGKFPSVLGRQNATTLPNLGRVLGVGGIPEKKRAARRAAAPTKKEQ